MKRLNIGDSEPQNATIPAQVPTAPPTFAPATVTSTPSPPAPIQTLTPEPVFAAPAVTPRPSNIPATLDDISKIGGDAQTQLAAVTQRITGVAKTSDMEGMGTLLNNTIMAAKGYDPQQLFKKGFFHGLFGKAQSLRMKFDTVDRSVQRLVGEIDQQIGLFRSRITDLSQLSEATQKYHDGITPQIAQLQQTADWMEQNQPEVDPNDLMSANKVQEWMTIISFARKRADDLRRAQVLAQQQIAQIAMLKTNSTSLAQKFSDIKVTTIPALQNVFTAYVIAMEQKKGADMADQIDKTTNDAIKMGASLMSQNTTQIQTALTRSNISMEALQANYQSVTQSLDEVKRIQAEMKTRLATEGPQLEQLSRDLSARLSQR